MYTLLIAVFILTWAIGGMIGSRLISISSGFLIGHCIYQITKGFM